MMPAPPSPATALGALLMVGCAGASPAPERATSEPACFERVIQTIGCSGADFSEEELAQRTSDLTLCDQCLEDAHCDKRGGGRCEMMQPQMCEHALRVCLYPGDDCYDPASCSASCFHQGGVPHCGRPDPPPP